MKTFQLEVVTPDATALSVRASALQAPAWEGYLGVLPGHAPLLCVLKPGVLTVRPESGPAQLFAVKGGFMEVTPEHVIVLADAIEKAKDIDVTAAEKALTEAQKATAPAPAADATKEKGSGAARAEASAAREGAVAWARARLDAADRSRAG
jgi:F-type H+-transporting ATPase subunit epsilon